MKKKILSAIFPIALLATTGYGVNRGMKSNAGLSNPFKPPRIMTLLLWIFLRRSTRSPICVFLKRNGC
ncbi:hypothetical protein D7D25_14865 [Proteiniphilum sp. X52]|nr:hypothetical protein D7D25_14865 [Proteiniphilum sp. X52]